MNPMYEMKLGESLWNSGMACNIVRVPGGWLFQTCDENNDTIPSMCFVPFNNEFMKISEDAEDQQKQTANIDYTAVLSEALSFVVSVQKCGYVEKHIPEVAAHLNAALQKQHCA